MAEAIWVVQAPFDSLGSTPIIDGIVAVVINKDSAQSAAQVRAAAVLQVNAAGHKVPANYFDAGVAPFRIDDLTSGPLKDDADAYVFSRRLIEKVEG